MQLFTLFINVHAHNIGTLNVFIKKVVRKLGY